MNPKFKENDVLIAKDMETKFIISNYLRIRIVSTGYSSELYYYLILNINHEEEKIQADNIVHRESFKFIESRYTLDLNFKLKELLETI